MEDIRKNDEKKSIDISFYYAKLEIENFRAIWEEMSQKINKLLDEDEPDSDTLVSIVNSSVAINKGTKSMRYMATLLSKQKACEAFLEEKGLSEEFADFAKNSVD